MANDTDSHVAPAVLTTEAVDIAIRFGLIVLLGYWSWEVIAPFLTILLWSAILAVALYPLFERLARWLGRPKLAAVLVTLLCALIVVAPVAWLGLGLISGVKFLANGIRRRISIPPHALSMGPGFASGR